MREIRIDTDTLIGYDYENSEFYITNKDTTTKRAKVQEAFKVLQVVAGEQPIDEHGVAVTIEELILLSTNMEYLTELYYTWEDTGAYIKTIQLNDYETHPLTIDAEKQKLYIMNSTIIFDLTLNEGRRERLLQIQAFYRDTLGLEVSLHDLQILYLVLVSFYTPRCYNEIQLIEDREDKENYVMRHTQNLILSNYNGSAPVTYTCACNPTNQYSYSVLANITEITENAITLTNSVPSAIQEGTIINLSNTAYDIDIASYSANGTYQVKEVRDNIVYTTENLPAPFDYNPPKLEIVAYKTPIVSASSQLGTLTLTNFPTGLLVGDTIVVEGTEIPTPYETLSIDGTYGIIDIENKTITVSETETVIETETQTLTETATETTVVCSLTLDTRVSTDYTDNQTGSYIYKPIVTNKVNTVHGATIHTEETIPATMTVNTPVCIDYVDYNGDTTHREYATVKAVSTNSITVAPQLENFTANYGLLREPVPFPYVLIDIVSSKRTDLLPTGLFMVDTPDQAIDYLSLLDYLKDYDLLPSNEELSDDKNGIGNFHNINKVVKNYYIINTVGETDHQFNIMKLKGLYSKVYEESEETGED